VSLGCKRRQPSHLPGVKQVETRCNVRERTIALTGAHEVLVGVVVQRRALAALAPVHDGAPRHLRPHRRRIRQMNGRRNFRANEVQSVVRLQGHASRVQRRVCFAGIIWLIRPRVAVPLHGLYVLSYGRGLPLQPIPRGVRRLRTLQVEVGLDTEWGLCRRVEGCAGGGLHH